MIDLRSDTVTRPTKPMLEAMMNAKVGDDIYGEDETVNALQEKCASMTGKEAALFVPTGVLGNQLSLKCHTIPGDEALVESNSHILNNETGAAAVISNIQLISVPGNNGIITAEDIKNYVRSSEYYYPVTRLICLENTHNWAGGVIQPINVIKEISGYAREINLKLHLDGARIFNACVETGISIKEYAGYFDSVSFCFSKGLGCPVGSIVCGSRVFIEMARKWRKILGGGMRQTGILAAAGIYALDNNIERLKVDNANAKYFAHEISTMKGINIDPESVQTNIVVFSSSAISKPDLMNRLKEKGVIISSGSNDIMRCVFHLDAPEELMKKAVDIFKEVTA
ncbi:MAG TPA: low-specificity L-threonine aldolase [Ignavibacteria bacterium]|nr:low-specificity L-threonine aldolase [Ignavibacteria bacterium]